MESVEVLCGDCGTWRRLVLRPRAVRALQRKLRRIELTEATSRR